MTSPTPTPKPGDQIRITRDVYAHDPETRYHRQHERLVASKGDRGIVLSVLPGSRLSALVEGEAVEVGVDDVEIVADTKG